MKATKQTEIARAIERWCYKYAEHREDNQPLYHPLSDGRIYFNGKAWDYNSQGRKSVIEDIRASEYFQYADDALVNMTFEGRLYEILNYHWSEEWLGRLYEEFDALIDGFNCWYELGNAWNLTIYED